MSARPAGLSGLSLAAPALIRVAQCRPSPRRVDVSSGSLWPLFPLLPPSRRVPLGFTDPSPLSVGRVSSRPDQVQHAGAGHHHLAPHRPHQLPTPAPSRPEGAARRHRHPGGRREKVRSTRLYRAAAPRRRGFPVSRGSCSSTARRRPCAQSWLDPTRTGLAADCTAGDRFLWAYVGDRVILVVCAGGVFAG